MADANHFQAGNSFRKLGFFTLHIQDGRLHAAKGGGTVLETPVERGAADWIIAQHGLTDAVECKYGDGADYRNFTFANWREVQRRWAAAWEAKGNTYWLFITVGTRAVPIGQKAPKGVRFPKISILMPSKVLLEIEASSTRKSLSYAEIQGLGLWTLTWKGSDTWGIPDDHPFLCRYRGIIQHDTERRNDVAV
jgi:hypothetical protein